MENKETFKMTYSAQQQEEVEAIRKKYAAPNEDKMAQLRALDAGVNRKASSASITIGVLGTLVMGVGMSLVMTDIGARLGELAMIIGVTVGVIGMLLAALAYPVYNRVLKKEKERIAPEILRLTDELLK